MRANVPGRSGERPSSPRPSRKPIQKLSAKRVTRDERLANLRASHTSFDTLAHAPQEEEIRIYGSDSTLAVYTTVLTIGGRYSGKDTQGRYRALVVWVRRQGRWQQVASQLTPILAAK